VRSDGGEREPDGRRVRLRRLGALVGVGLLAAALWMVWRQREIVGAALASVPSARPLEVSLLLGSVLANVALSAATLRTLLGRYGSVGALEMQAVVAAATLLNSVPMRPGVFGRIAYHRVVNGIAVVDCAKTVVQAAVITTVVAAWLALVAVVSIPVGLSLWYGVVGPIPLLAAAAARPAWRRWLVATVLRYLEVLVWAVRYHAAFALIGAPLDPTAALAFACVGTIASMIPFLGGGLGVREWAIGLLAPVLASAPIGLGVTGDLVNRAAAAVIIGALGPPSALWAVRRMRRASGTGR